ncbi:hypothetical protein Hdeb2414_s0015g00451591 [Helianthus debilis subsp. tardiflorus]
MPMEPNSGVWRALLNGCKVYGDIELGELVAKKLINLNPSDPRNYIMLSSIYSKAGRWVEFSKVSVLMKDQGDRRQVGAVAIGPSSHVRLAYFNFLVFYFLFNAFHLRQLFSFESV